MADKKLKLELDIATKAAQSNLKNAAKEAKKLGTTLDDTRSAGKKMADAMSQVADDIDSEFAQSTKAAQKLEQALGPEISAAFKKQGKSVHDVVADLKAAGLTYQEIEADADDLAASIKRLNDVGSKVSEVSAHADNLGTSMHKVAGEADNTRSVFSNFAGNAAQELPGISGAFGPLNMAISQFVEYASEGNINLLSMAAAAGPMLGIAVAIELVQRHLKEVAAVKAFNKKQVDSFTASIIKGEDAATALRDRLAETAKIEWHLNRMFGGDAFPALAKAGLSVDNFTQAVLGGEDGLHKLSEAMNLAGVDTDSQVAVLLAAKSYQDDYNQAVKTSAAFLKVFGNESENAKKVTEAVAKAVDAVTTALDKQGAAYDELMGKLSDDDSYQNLMLNLDDLGKTLADLHEQELKGELTHEEALRKSALAINATKEEMMAYAQEVLKVPTYIATEIAANIDEGKFALAKQKLDALAGTRTALINTVVRQSDVHTASKTKVGQSAVGGTASGLTLVGETGPELVNLPQGSHVTTANQTANLLNRSGTGHYIDNRTFNISIPSATPEIVNSILARYNRRNGL